MKTGLKERASKARNGWRLALLTACCGLFLIPQSADAWIFHKNLRGTFNWAYYEATTSGTTQSSDRKELNATWFKNITPYLNFSSSVAYYKTDLDRTHERSLFTKEFSPSGKLTLNHPKLRLSTGLTRTESRKTNSLEDLIRDDFSTDLLTRFDNLPILSAQYRRGRVQDDISVHAQNATDNGLGIGLTHDWEDWSTRYRLTVTHYKDHVSQVRAQSTQHSIYTFWSKDVVYKKPITLSVDYQLNLQSRTDEVPLDSVIRQDITGGTALFAQNQDEYYGALSVNNGLTDGDLTSPTDPPINIGTEVINWHIGIDLHTRKEVSGFRIYTDRLSDDAVTWEVYNSLDGVTWQLHSAAPISVFDIALGRYEITWDPIVTRYIKVVSGGVNRIEEVYVTELKVLAAPTDVNRLKQSSTSHLITAGARSQLNEKWRGGVNFTLQKVPSVGLGGGQTSFSQEYSASYDPTENLQHSFRFQNSVTSASGNYDDYSDFMLSYGARYEPLPTLRLNGSSNGRISRVNGNHETSNISFAGSIMAIPIEDLTFEYQASYSWDDQQTSDRQIGSWNHRYTLDARPNRYLQFRATYGHRTVNQSDGPDIKPTDDYSLMVTLTPVPKVRVSGQLNQTKGRYLFKQERLLASWSITRTLTVTGQYYYSDNSEGYRSERQTVNFSWRIFSWTDIYIGYSENELSSVNPITYAVNGGVRIRL